MRICAYAQDENMLRIVLMSAMILTVGVAAMPSASAVPCTSGAVFDKVDCAYYTVRDGAEDWGTWGFDVADCAIFGRC